MPAMRHWSSLIEAPKGFMDLKGIPFEDWPDEFCMEWPWLGGNIKGHVRVNKKYWSHQWSRTKAVYRHQGKRVHPIRLIYPYFTGCDPDVNIRLKRQLKLPGRAVVERDNVNPYFYETYDLNKQKRPQAEKRPMQIEAIYDLWPLTLPAPTSVSELLERFPELASHRTCDLEETIKNM